MITCTADEKDNFLKFFFPMKSYYDLKDTFIRVGSFQDTQGISYM